MTPDDGSANALLALIEEGIAASADALAEVSRTSWETQTVSISTDDTSELSSIQARMAGDDKEHYGAFMSMPGAVFLMMLPKTSGPGVAKAFIGERKARPGAKPPSEGTCIAEVANVVVNAVANTMANACEDSFLLSAPTMIVGQKKALLDIALKELKATGEKYAVMTYVSMSSEALSSDCTVLLLLSPACRGRILKALGS